MKILDDNGMIVQEMTLTGRKIIKDNIPNPKLLSAVKMVGQGQPRDVLTPVRYGPGEPPPIILPSD